MIGAGIDATPDVSFFLITRGGILCVLGGGVGAIMDASVEVKATVFGRRNHRGRIVVLEVTFFSLGVIFIEGGGGEDGTREVGSSSTVCVRCSHTCAAWGMFLLHHPGWHLEGVEGGARSQMYRGLTL